MKVTYTIDGLRSNNGGATHTVLSTSLNSDPWSQGNANQIIPGSCTEITNVVVEFYYNGSPRSYISWIGCINLYLG